MENVLEIKNISKNYKGFSLKDVSFNIPKGFVMGLICLLYTSRCV